MMIGNVDAFKEAMNASYMPVPMSNPGTADAGMDFMKTMEDTTSRDSVDISTREQDINKKDINERDREINQQSENKEEKVNRDQNDRSERNGDQVNDKESETKPDEQLNKDGQGVKTEANGEKDKPAKTKKGKNSNNNGKAKNFEAVKEALKQKQVQQGELGEAAEEVKEKVNEAKTTTTTNTAEKLALKNLGGENAADGKSGDPGSGKGDELAREMKFLEEFDVVKKEDTGQKSDTKVQTGPKSQDNTFFNLLNENSKNLQQVNEIKVKKVLSYQSMLDQYQGMKDKINENVENSIKFLMTNGENRVTMKLMPPELGKVEIELIMKDNQVNAKINTENIAVKEVILNNLEQLRSNLEQAGTGIDKFDVEVGGFKSHLDQHFANGKSDGDKKGGAGRGNGNDDETGDPNEPIPGKIKNHRALTLHLGRSINVVI